MASDVDGAPAEAAERKDAMASIAGQITKLSTGDRARLRRIYLTQSYDADGVVIGLLHHAGEPIPDRAAPFARWRLIAHVAALLSGTAAIQPHARNRSVGRALHAAGYSENRLLRLTAARGEPLFDQIVRVARVLARAGEPVDLWTLFNLTSDNRTRAEEARLQIARDYYAAAAASK